MVADLFTGTRVRGRSCASDRLMLDGVLRVLCSGAAWRGTPECFGPWPTVYHRFRGWRNQRTLDHATRFDKLAKSSAAMVSLACSLRGLRQLFSYRAKSASTLIVGQAWRDGERAILALGLASWWLDVGC